MVRGRGGGGGRRRLLGDEFDALLVIDGMLQSPHTAFINQVVARVGQDKVAACADGR